MIKIDPPIPLQTITYFDWPTLRKDLESRDWTEDDLEVILSDDISNGTMTSFDAGFILDNPEIHDQNEIAVALSLINLGYPRKFNIWVWW